MLMVPTGIYQCSHNQKREASPAVGVQGSALAYCLPLPMVTRPPNSSWSGPNGSHPCSPCIRCCEIAARQGQHTGKRQWREGGGGRGGGGGGVPPPPPSVAVGWCRHFAIIRKISHSSLRHVYAGREKVNPDIDRVSAGCSACCDLAAIVSMQNVQPASRHIVAILRALVTCSARHKTASAGF